MSEDELKPKSHEIELWRVPKDPSSLVRIDPEKCLCDIKDARRFLCESHKADRKYCLTKEEAKAYLVYCGMLQYRLAIENRW